MSLGGFPKKSLVPVISGDRLKVRGRKGMLKADIVDSISGDSWRNSRDSFNYQ